MVNSNFLVVHSNSIAYKNSKRLNNRVIIKHFTIVTMAQKQKLLDYKLVKFYTQPNFDISKSSDHSDIYVENRLAHIANLRGLLIWPFDGPNLYLIQRKYFFILNFWWGGSAYFHQESFLIFFKYLLLK